MEIYDRLTRRTPRLTVRLLRAIDRDAWIAAHVASGEHFTRWMPRADPSVSMAQRFEAQLDRAVDGVVRDVDYVFVAEHRADRDLVAFCTLSQVWRGPFQNAYASWRVSLRRANQGYGVEAVTALLDLAFAASPDGIGLHRVQANVIPTNEPSLRLARRVGFREEGYAVKYLEIDGRWQDHVMFAIVADEWFSRSRATPR